MSGSPPPYEQFPSSTIPTDEKKSIASIKSQLAHARSLYITQTANKLYTILLSRTSTGLSKPTFALLPPRHFDHGTKCELVGFGGDESVVSVPLDDAAKSAQDFWAQGETLRELQSELNRMIESSNDGHVAAPIVWNEKDSGGFWKGWSKKRSAVVEGSVSTVHVPAVKVDMKLLHVRTENAFGLFETVAVQAVIARVVV